MTIRYQFSCLNKQFGVINLSKVVLLSDYLIISLHSAHIIGYPLWLLYAAYKSIDLDYYYY